MSLHPCLYRLRPGDTVIAIDERFPIEKEVIFFFKFYGRFSKEPFFIYSNWYSAATLTANYTVISVVKKKRK
jgi:hypothetical protein